MHFATYKTILSPKNGMNIYRGCSHGCIYCDARSDCYQFTHEFTDIEVKERADEILDAQLAKKRKPCMISTGAMCDPYIHLEEKLCLTRRCLEVIYKRGFGVAIQTKSARILRDFDLLCAINERAKAVVQMTLTTYDDALCGIVEPDVSLTSERFDVLCKFRDAGVPAVVWLCPILPFINDTEENLRGVLDYCVRAGVKGIVAFGMGVTLRAGDREYFYAALDRHFPGMRQQYVRTFGNSYECLSSHSDKLYGILRDVCRKNGILYKPADVFGYMGEFPKEEQLSMF
jgi:DNA repair photolyase